ncbi:MAG: flagellar export chaperone FlgN [Armatimonadota bacterium]|nr:flagellar export chaperone FlgN [Armatimonadota bacterium]
MTADPIVSVLKAELDTARALVETLEQQRRALIARDLERLNELTEILEGQFEHFNVLLQTRAQAMREAPDLTDRHGELMRRIARVEVRVMDLAALNQDLVADRLAYVGAMLAVILPDCGDGYRPEGGRPALTVSRSA